MCALLETFLLQCVFAYESFRKYGVPYFGALIIRTLLFRVLYYIRVPYFRKFPHIHGISRLVACRVCSVGKISLVLRREWEHGSL